ncbi:MAG: polyprenyl synthetase family protein [Chloroflexi bacterium]|nr:polyprenyl synthetase family protein [Chloroflexota bacterium]
MIDTAVLYAPVVDDIPLVGERLRGLSNGHHPLLGETLAYVFETGGKRIRPALVMLSGKLGRYDVGRLVTLASALEVVHTATLVHDDTIDQALTRRGLKTVNALWNSKVAILVGDFLFAQSAHLAAQLNSVRIMSLLSETVMDMSSGELRQYASSQDRTIDEEDYFRRIAGKTASLFGMCCQGAAIVSDQPEEQIEALREYGVNLGIAFQIADDVLDFAADEAELGKPAGNDLRQGTITLPAILLAQWLPANSAAVGDLKAGRNVEGVIEAVRGSGVLDEALLRARQYADAARAALAPFPDSEAREALLLLADHVTRRRR